MKYDLMLIGPATRDVNIDYTGKEVHEIGGAVFLLRRSSQGGWRKTFSLRLRSIRTTPISLMRSSWTATTSLSCRAKTTTLMQNTYFTADRERRKAECLAQSGPITPDQIPEVDCGLYHLAGLLYGEFPERADRRAEKSAARSPQISRASSVITRAA